MVAYRLAPAGSGPTGKTMEIFLQMVPIPSKKTLKTMVETKTDDRILSTTENLVRIDICLGAVERENLLITLGNYWCFGYLSSGLRWGGRAKKVKKNIGQ
jgi:hypothetical protein